MADTLIILLKTFHNFSDNHVALKAKRGLLLIKRLFLLFGPSCDKTERSINGQHCHGSTLVHFPQPTRRSRGALQAVLAGAGAEPGPGPKTILEPFKA